MKILLIGLLLFIQTPFARKLSGHNGSKPDNSENQSQQNKKIPDSATVRNQPTGPSAEKKTQDNIGQSEQVQIVADDRPRKDRWDIASICATIALVFVGIITFGAIWYQAIKTRDATEAIERQTRAVEDSVALQKTLKRQWLEYENWHIEPNWGLDDINSFLRLFFSISNKTDMPLTILSISLVPSVTPDVDARTTIAPNNSHPVVRDIDLSKEQIKNFMTDTLAFTLTGNVAYQDAFKDFRNQGVSRNFIGGKSGFTSTEGPGWIPSEEDEEQD